MKNISTVQLFALEHYNKVENIPRSLLSSFKLLTVMAKKQE